MQSFQLYEPGSSFLYRMDPRVKLIAVAAVFTVSVLFQDARYLAPVFVFLLGVAVAGRVPLRRVALLLKSLAVLVAISMVMWPLIYRQGEVVFEVVGLGVTDAGLRYGMGMSFRILDMVIAPIILFLTTPQSDFVAGLRRLGLPYRAAFALAMAFRFLPTVAGVGQTIVEAQRARGMDPSAGGVRQRIRNHSRILGPLVITSLRIAQQTILAVEARAFSIGRPRTTFKSLTFRPVDTFAVVFLVAVVVAAAALRLQGRGVL
ncbi:energy-coupling factor transporter transmembrane protein EcfT [Dactylosporangium roseum]|uniref:Energy-coupling factor transporter transmembrane protein EcfT n=1 Tax=Dactylosporangium roseum TaxID=47989 RepID=A0ABY5ZAM6_9ACTN|nr:energy-coupling factor transporter transmembrane component T [Dactylosporangium roseum]UWZ39141.1 energy-coupling factor transporter transmembrane protein EcfT [Dactylosporangium roseum]